MAKVETGLYYDFVRDLFRILLRKTVIEMLVTRILLREMIIEMLLVTGILLRKAVTEMPTALCSFVYYSIANSIKQAQELQRTQETYVSKLIVVSY